MAVKVFEANTDSGKDALNNSIKVGDNVAYVTYRGSVSGATNIGLRSGKIIKFTDSFIVIQDSDTNKDVRKSTRYVVKI